MSGPGGGAADAANLVEVFSSVQGEGPHVGLATLFVRFGECDLRCRWCDSPETWRPAASCRVERARGRGEFAVHPNPVALDEVVAWCEALALRAHAFVSLTGGEPLLQPEAVAGLAERLRGRGPRIFLETHGLAVAALTRVVHLVDVVSMDWKLASDVRRAADPKRGPVADFHREHERFLAVAGRAPEVIVKLVITPSTTEAELDQAVERLAAARPVPEVVLQPVTPTGGVREPVPAERLLALAAACARRLPELRLIPQTHKLLGAR